MALQQGFFERKSVTQPSGSTSTDMRTRSDSHPVVQVTAVESSINQGKLLVLEITLLRYKSLSLTEITDGPYIDTKVLWLNKSLTHLPPAPPLLTTLTHFKY